ncbi:MAG TPA: hypothetical protein VN661_12885 [Candidatus Acidoferrales bacterium]|nr:hypothetical protein [Candidatus Acidoferrales bacterium]
MPPRDANARNIVLHRSLLLFFAVVLVASFWPAPARAQEPETVTIRVDAATSLGPSRPVWDFFGYDEPNYTYAPHGSELVRELSALDAAPVYIRAHNLLTTGDGTPSLKWGSTNAYTEDSTGKPVYDWTIVDRIFDTYIQAGARPYVEIGFMPEALSTHPEPYRHNFPKGPLYTGWSYPPKDYAKWAGLVHAWVRHCVEKYGAARVATWYWEVWNEPDIGYWHGTPEQYDKLYDYTADAVKRAFPSARVGGPATSGTVGARAAGFLQQFLEHCATGKNFATGKQGAPLDFISFHAKGGPQFVDGHQRMGSARHLRQVNGGFKIIHGFAKFAKLPVFISESDPDGCAACTPQMDPRYGYRNTTLYPVYTAAVLNSTEELAAQSHIRLAGVLTWAFEFEDQPIFTGFRTLATQGVDKPQLNFFRMAGLMRGERVKAESSGAITGAKMIETGVRDRQDVDAIAARAERGITALIWNYQDDDVPGNGAAVKLEIAGIPPTQHRVLLRHYRLDGGHSNAYTVWQAMGSPRNPTPEQFAKLRQAGQLQLLESPRWVSCEKGTLEVQFTLPREAASLVAVSW